MWINLWLRGRFAFVNLPLVESAVVEHSVSAYGLRYHDIRLSYSCMLRGLGRAMRMRKPGTGWFAAVRRRADGHAPHALAARPPAPSSPTPAGDRR